MVYRKLRDGKILIEKQQNTASHIVTLMHKLEEFNK